MEGFFHSWNWEHWNLFENPFTFYGELLFAVYHDSEVLDQLSQTG